MANESYDQSHIEKKYFIDGYTYNCPFCNVRNVRYEPQNNGDFDWSRERKCYYHTIRCTHCGNESFHLSFYDLDRTNSGRFEMPPTQKIHGDDKTYTVEIEKDGKAVELDDVFFFHQPTSFFTVDNRIPEIIRELISEAEGCLKMNHLTGASACMRKAIYELTVIEKCTGEHYEDRIKELKKKHPAIDEALIDVLGHIKDMASDKIHEQSWDKWDSGNLKLIIETLKTVLYEIYVEPANKKERLSAVKQLLAGVKKPKKKEAPAQPQAQEGA